MQGSRGAGNVFRIIMPGPLLTITPQPATSNQLLLSWRTNYTGFTLQCSDSLASPNWHDCTNAPSIADGRFWVTNSSSLSAQFFRLRR